MVTNAEKFLDLLLRSGALQFGSFKTKSGRMSPFFFNTGHFDHGNLLSEVATCYANLIWSKFSGHPIHLYGPAYKGITLASATAQELARQTNSEVPFTFNRKEMKTHGEGGSFIGRRLTADSKLIVVEDVMTGGTSVRETLELLKPIGSTVAAVVIGVDRQERGMGDRVASAEIAENFNIPVYSILTLDDIIDRLWNKPRMDRVWIDDEMKKSIDAYRQAYGA